jgi:hypothetical protein
MKSPLCQAFCAAPQKKAGVPGRALSGPEEQEQRIKRRNRVMGGKRRIKTSGDTI